MTRAFDAAMRAAIAAFALFAVLAALAVYLCATGGMPCTDDIRADQCRFDEEAPLQGTVL